MVSVLTKYSLTTFRPGRSVMTPTSGDRLLLHPKQEQMSLLQLERLPQPPSLYAAHDDNQPLKSKARFLNRRKGKRRRPSTRSRTPRLSRSARRKLPTQMTTMRLPAPSLRRGMRHSLVRWRTVPSAISASRSPHIQSRAPMGVFSAPPAVGRLPRNDKDSPRRRLRDGRLEASAHAAPYKVEFSTVMSEPRALPRFACKL